MLSKFNPPTMKIYISRDDFGFPSRKPLSPFTENLPYHLGTLKQVNTATGLV